MAKIAILCDIEVGHLFPSFALADMLREDAHEVIYLVIKDMEKYVQDAGYPSRIIFPEIYPAGALKEHERLRQSTGDPRFKEHLLPLLRGSLDQVLMSMKPNLLLIDYSLSFEALIIHHKYSIRQVFFSTFLRGVLHTPKAVCVGTFMLQENDAPSAVLEFILQQPGFSNCANLEDLASSIDNIPELILCPKEFDFPERDFANQPVYHIGPCIRNVTAGNGSDHAISDQQKTIFLSFGSQTSLYGEAFTGIIRELLIAMQFESLSAFRLIVTLGNYINENQFADIPPNVTMMNWSHQYDWISRSSLVITHGGLGTIKECIYFGVPMIVIPMMRDQPENASRIERHNIGKKLDHRATARTFETAILHVLNNEEIKKNMGEMMHVFRKSELEKKGCKIINELLYT